MECRQCVHRLCIFFLNIVLGRLYGIIAMHLRQLSWIIVLFWNLELVLFQLLENQYFLFLFCESQFLTLVVGMSLVENIKNHHITSTKGDNSFG